MATMTDKDLIILENLDFEPVCEYLRRVNNPTPCQNPAELIVWSKDPCSCRGVRIRNFCQECYDYRTDPNGVYKCSVCGIPVPDPLATIIMVERIKGS